MRQAVQHRIRAGATFAVPLKDGRYGAVRVIRVSEEKQGSMALVAVTTWLASEVPALGERALREVLRRHRGRFGVPRGDRDD